MSTPRSDTQLPLEEALGFTCRILSLHKIHFEEHRCDQNTFLNEGCKCSVIKMEIKNISEVQKERGGDSLI